MHIPTHILSGWCGGNLVRLNARERGFCMVAAAAPDLDGLGILAGEEWYWRFHHVLGHNLAFGLLVAGVLTIFSSRRTVAFATYVALFHVHLLMDFFGSGPGWGIAYFWPFSEQQWKTELAWELSSWQNRMAAGVLLAWTIWIAIARGWTPVEQITPRLDRLFVEKLRRLFRRAPAQPEQSGLAG